MIEDAAEEAAQLGLGGVEAIVGALVEGELGDGARVEPVLEVEAVALAPARGLELGVGALDS